jgi:hypothetical protein
VSHKIIKRLPQVSSFSPNIAVTPENDEVWITLKDVGKVHQWIAMLLQVCRHAAAHYAESYKTNFHVRFLFRQ